MGNKSLAVFRSTRPQFLVLTPICVLLALALAFQNHTAVNMGLACLVIVGALSAHISVNTFNEYFDYTSGLDKITERTPFSGGSGGIVACPGALNAVLFVAVLSLLITSAIGIYLITIKGYLLMTIGLVGVVTILAYTRWINRSPLLCLIAPGLAFGPLFVFGTYISVVEEYQWSMQLLLTVLLVSLVPFFLVNNLLLLNQFPDIYADKQIGRKTFPIAFGMRTSIYLYLIFIGLAAISVALAVSLGYIPLITLLTIVPIGVGVHICIGVLHEKFVTKKIIPYMGKNVAVTLSSISILAATLTASRFI